MNKERRKQLAAIDSLIGSIRETLEAAKADAESIRNDEQSYYDGMPDSIRDGMKGDRTQEAIDSMDELIFALEEADTALENASGYIESAGE